MKTIALHYAPNTLTKLMRRGRSKDFYLEVGGKLLGPFTEQYASEQYEFFVNLNY